MRILVLSHNLSNYNVFRKFITTLMKNGDKKMAILLVNKTFENIKRQQLELYHKATTSEVKDNIELDPFVIFHRAIDNCTPILQLRSTSKGGITYQVIHY